ncbi:hypothetical protein KI387_036428, partial [Taxus chinensis]
EEDSSEESESQEGDASGDEKDVVEIDFGQNLRERKSKNVPSLSVKIKRESSMQGNKVPVNTQLEQQIEALGQVGPVKGDNHLSKM